MRTDWNLKIKKDATEGNSLLGTGNIGWGQPLTSNGSTQVLVTKGLGGGEVGGKTRGDKGEGEKYIYLNKSLFLQTKFMIGGLHEN